MKMSMLCCLFFITLLLTNKFFFLYMDLQKIAKTKSITRALHFFRIFGMNVVVFLFTSMHVLNFMIWDVCHVLIWRWLYGSVLLFYDLPKRGSAKILARSSISSKSQIKVNFKALPPDRDYFKVYFFYKRGKFSNNPVPYVSLNS